MHFPRESGHHLSHCIVWGGSHHLDPWLQQVFDPLESWCRRRQSRDSDGSPPLRLVLWAFGGLASEAELLTRARALRPHFLANDCYPLFLVWSAGLRQSAETLLPNLDPTDLPDADTGARFEAHWAEPELRPLWTALKARAEQAWEPGDSGHALLKRLQTLAGRWGRQLELHLVGHSAGALLLGHLLTSLVRAEETVSPLRPEQVRSLHLLAPACSLDFANQHFAPHAPLMRGLCLELLSDPIERLDRMSARHGQSWLYLVSNALEARAPTPLLGLATSLRLDDPDWATSPETTPALQTWRRAMAAAGLAPDSRRITRIGAPRVYTSVITPEPTLITTSHHRLDEDLEVLTRAICRIRNQPLQHPVEDLRG